MRFHVNDSKSGIIYRDFHILASCSNAATSDSSCEGFIVEVDVVEDSSAQMKGNDDLNQKKYRVNENKNGMSKCEIMR